MADGAIGVGMPGHAFMDKADRRGQVADGRIGLFDNGRPNDLHEYRRLEG